MLPCIHLSRKKESIHHSSTDAIHASLFCFVFYHHASYCLVIFLEMIVALKRAVGVR